MATGEIIAIVGSVFPCLGNSGGFPVQRGIFIKYRNFGDQLAYSRQDAVPDQQFFGLEQRSGLL